MLFTRESDYAIRVVRALKDGEKKSIRQICAVEEIPEAFCYKIVKKLEHALILRDPPSTAAPHSWAHSASEPPAPPHSFLLYYTSRSIHTPETSCGMPKK